MSLQWHLGLLSLIVLAFRGMLFYYRVYACVYSVATYVCVPLTVSSSQQTYTAHLWPMHADT